MDAVTVIQGYLGQLPRDSRWQCAADALAEEARQLTGVLNEAPSDPARREALVRALVGRPVGAGLDLTPPVFIDFGKNLHIGKNVTIGAHCHFQDQGGITLGDGCTIGAGAVLVTGSLTTELGGKRQEVYRPIILGKNARIGGGAIVLPGVTVGESALIAPGAVVTGDIPPFARAEGIPARWSREPEWELYARLRFCEEAGNRSGRAASLMALHDQGYPSVIRLAAAFLMGDGVHPKPGYALELLQELPLAHLRPEGSGIYREEDMEEVVAGLIRHVEQWQDPWSAHALNMMDQRVYLECLNSLASQYAWNALARSAGIPGAEEMYSCICRNDGTPGLY